MTKNKEYFMLYSDIAQQELLAIANNKEEVKSVTQYYTDGQWFSCKLDPKNEKFILEGTEKKITIKFPKIAKKYIKDKIEDNWKIGGSDIR